MSVVRSLRIEAVQVDGRWLVTAPWCPEGVIADTWFEAYWRIVRAR